MKNFFKLTCATMLGMLLFAIVVAVIGSIAIAGMISSEDTAKTVSSGSILRINLNGIINEQRATTPLSMFDYDDGSTPYGLDELLQAIRKAKTNSKVQGIYLAGGMPLAAPATIKEIRDALADFKESGKFIYAYSDVYSQSGYYICSVADSVVVNPSGNIDWHGLSSQPIFYKEMLEKFGVKMQVFKVGTYKSAVEPYTSTAMSEANREQVTSYLSSIWKQTVEDVGKSRGLSSAKLNAYADSFMLLMPAQKLVEWKLADCLAYPDEMKSMLKEKIGLSDDKIPFASVTDMANTSESGTSSRSGQVAVYYAFGEIVATEVKPYLMSNDNYIVGNKVVRELDELRRDKNVKAVVVRVNSPGGSAYASEQIWHEIERLKAEKPVVVSMGGYAASGGYYISCGANRIYAEPTTITGSIGIFGLIPDVSELLTQKLGLHFDAVKTNALSDFGTLSRPLSAEEGRLVQGEIDRGYETFVSRVAAGRNMSVEAVKQIAEGRVWTGEQALSKGLVDELGNLEAAVAHAAEMAELEDYRTEAYPKPEPWYKGLWNDKKEGYMDSKMREMLGEYYSAFSLLRALNVQDRVQARLPYDPNIY